MQTRSRALPLFAVVMLSTTLFGCPKKYSDGMGSDGGSAASSSGAAPGASQAASAKPAVMDLCALIPVATVASTTGVPVNGTDPTNDSGIPNCSYRASGKNPRIIIQKSLSTLPGVKSLWPGGRELSGIGDAAYLTPKSSELDVQKGKVVIRVAYEPGPAPVSDDAHVEVLKKLANLALPVLAN